MSAKFSRDELARFFFGAAFALIGAWALEAWMVGRGVISVYMAPIGLMLMAASLILKENTEKT